MFLTDEKSKVRIFKDFRHFYFIKTFIKDTAHAITSQIHNLVLNFII